MRGWWEEGTTGNGLMIRVLESFQNEKRVILSGKYISLSMNKRGYWNMMKMGVAILMKVQTIRVFRRKIITFIGEWGINGITLYFKLYISVNRFK